MKEPPPAPLVWRDYATTGIGEDNRDSTETKPLLIDPDSRLLFCHSPKRIHKKRGPKAPFSVLLQL
jgi:hypothetical protein